MPEDNKPRGYDPEAPANNAGHDVACGSDGLCKPCLEYSNKLQPELWPNIDEADDVDSLYIDYGGG